MLAGTKGAIAKVGERPRIQVLDRRILHRAVSPSTGCGGLLRYGRLAAECDYRQQSMTPSIDA